MSITSKKRSLTSIETIIINPNINRIIALSDIHSDIHSFIICLRDCARVIRKNINFAHNKSDFDIDLEKLLELDLNTDNQKYIDDLNFEWIGGTTNIVICGDILDGSREIKYKKNFIRNPAMKRYPKYPSRCPKLSCKGCAHCIGLEYDQVEIKLLRFINKINEYAMIAGGRIYKILGNHDIMNLNMSKNLSDNYIPEFTFNLGNKYYNGLSRKEYFNLGNPGSELLLQDNAYLLLMINNNIFVHGQLDHTKDITYYISTNNEINDGSSIYNPTYLDNLDNYSKNITTWGRDYSKRENDENKCEDIKNFLSIFIDSVKSTHTNYIYNLEDIRVVIGHCPQFFGNKLSNGVINSTFKNITIDKNREILDNQ